MDVRSHILPLILPYPTYLASGLKTPFTISLINKHDLGLSACRPSGNGRPGTTKDQKLRLFQTNPSLHWTKSLPSQTKNLPRCRTKMSLMKHLPSPLNQSPHPQKTRTQNNHLKAHHANQRHRP